MYESENNNVKKRACALSCIRKYNMKKSVYINCFAFPCTLCDIETKTPGDQKAFCTSFVYICKDCKLAFTSILGVAWSYDTFYNMYANETNGYELNLRQCSVFKVLCDIRRRCCFRCVLLLLF